MRCAFHFAVVILGLCLSLVCSSGAYAFPVTWTLSGVTFNDGGTATGSFVYDSDTGTVSNWSISVAGGTSGIPAFTYNPADLPGSFAIVQASSPNFITATYDPVGHFTIRSIQWDLGSSLSDAGGTVAITADGNSYECIDCSPYRLITAGSLIGTAAPNITSANATTFTVGTAGTFTVTTTGFPTPSLSETGALPGSVTFTDNGNGTATLSGPATSSGTFPITITASNGVAPDATQNFTLTVDQAPAITSAASTTFTVGAAGSFTVTSTGAPNAALSESGTLPAGVTFVDNGNGTATLSGTPTTGTGGTYALTITASNGVAPDATQNFTLTVDAPPTITSPNSATFQNNVSSSFTVTTTAFPTPALTMSGTLPSGVTFTDNGNGTATVSGTSTASGTYNLTITASNGIAPNATQAFTLVVQAPAVVTSTPGLTMFGMLILGLLLMLAVFATGRGAPHRE